MTYDLALYQIGKTMRAEEDLIKIIDNLLPLYANDIKKELNLGLEFDKKKLPERYKHLEIILKTGYLIDSPFVFSQPASYHKEFLNIYKNAEGKDKEDRLLAFFKKIFQNGFDKDKKNEKEFKGLEKILDSWSNNPYFKQRKIIIEEGFECHQKSLFSASVATFITQIEGIAAEISGNVGGSSGLKSMEWFKDKGDRGKLLYVIALILLFSDNDKKKDRKTGKLTKEAEAFKKLYSNRLDAILNRHSILHGQITNFGTEANSYRCILILDTLLQISNRIIKK